MKRQKKKGFESLVENTVDSIFVGFQAINENESVDLFGGCGYTVYGCTGSAGAPCFTCGLGHC